MSNELQGKRIAFMTATEGVEQVELTEPWKALEKAGAELELLSTKRGKVQAYQPSGPGRRVPDGQSCLGG